VRNVTKPLNKKDYRRRAEKFLLPVFPDSVPLLILERAPDDHHAHEISRVADAPQSLQ
jgi:hypothetical protein